MNLQIFYVNLYIYSILWQKWSMQMSRFQYLSFWMYQDIEKEENLARLNFLYTAYMHICPIIHEEIKLNFFSWVTTRCVCYMTPKSLSITWSFCAVYDKKDPENLLWVQVHNLSLTFLGSVFVTGSWLYLLFLSCSGKNSCLHKLHHRNKASSLNNLNVIYVFSTPTSLHQRRGQEGSKKWRWGRDRWHGVLSFSASEQD